MAKDHEPALAGDRLHPIVFLSGGWLGSEVNIHRAVGIYHQPPRLTADTWKLLIGLHHRARLVVVDDH